MAFSSAVSDGAEWSRTGTPEVRSLTELANTEFQFIWRSLRRLGVWPADAVDDAAQRVFEVATAKWRAVLPGKERAYLYRIAVFVAAEERRARRVGQREQPDYDVVCAARAPGAEPESAYQAQQHRAHLDEVLLNMDASLREVFVLYELERLSSVEIAELLSIPVGTASSRLRRARESFLEAAERLRKRLAFSGDLP